jgi:hypothetical protein
MTDTERIDYLERLIQACPHTVITHNDDPDVEGVSMGFSISTDGCESRVDTGKTLREVIDNASARDIAELLRDADLAR